jgi:hypothetical protein
MAQPALKQKIDAPRDLKPAREGKVLQAKPAQKTRTFHATVVVTRAEQWSVEAVSAEEARRLIEAGHGHRGQVGECLHFEVETLEH